MVDVPAVTAVYWQHYRQSKGSRPERLAAADSFWAWEAVDDVVQRGGADVLPLLDALLEAPGADAGYVGAGPVEDLLASDDGDRWDGLVAERCRRSAAWREAVAAVWLEEQRKESLVSLRPFFSAGRRG